MYACIGIGEESDDELSTGAVVAISIVVTFIITLVVTALITYIITSMYYKYRYELKEKVKVVDDKNVNTKQKDPYGGNITMDTNPAYGTATAIKMILTQLMLLLLINPYRSSVNCDIFTIVLLPS